MTDKEEKPPNKDPNLKGWEFLEKFACLELWSKGKQRLVYDTKKKDIVYKYVEGKKFDIN